MLSGRVFFSFPWKIKEVISHLEYLYNVYNLLEHLLPYFSIPKLLESIN